jgi:parallel beta-helix repeat protein
VKFIYSTSDLIVFGTLDVQGTADNQVIFTSYKDDTYGADTNGDGTATLPAAGDWDSIKIYNSSTTLAYALIQYGGLNNGSIYVSIFSSPTIEHNLIRYNSTGVYVHSGSPTITQNDITGNTNYGVYNHSTTTIDATGNWWGDASGPSGVGTGSGDAVSDYVAYTPWLDAPVNPISDPLPPSSSLLTYLPFVLR